MTRKKRIRKVGSEGTIQHFESFLSKDDVASLARKRTNRCKGLKAGTRYSDSTCEQQYQAKTKVDQRLGSKKLIPLVVEAPLYPKSATGKKVCSLNATQK
ncbi:Protein of unknown function DUF414 [Candidatus Enterovibrio altilux]|uniref:Uncharacterized protein n=1 Tax=Candidatus Enterovibrio altilux TaxID=1927128 RepID=A0A291B9B9_9GAMM|nr:Protein of unknown function DUF414 [Candidatus Enterovibrio luxaltus]